MHSRLEKEKLRRAMGRKGQHALPQAGKIAQQVRRLPAYREARQLFAGPGPLLRQVRINALLDGKELVMPAPGLKQGFYWFRPHSIPPRALSLAVTFKGMARYGERLTRVHLAGLAVDLLLTEALAVDRAGRRLGRGSGFFDLSCGVLGHFQALNGKPPAYAVGSADLLCEVVPVEPWDISLSGLVTPKGLMVFGEGGAAGAQIHWEALEIGRIRKIDPLWWAYGDRQEREE